MSSSSSSSSSDSIEKPKKTLSLNPWNIYQRNRIKNLSPEKREELRKKQRKYSEKTRLNKKIILEQEKEQKRIEDALKKCKYCSK
jgi:hypothetical protein